MRPRNGRLVERYISTTKEQDKGPAAQQEYFDQESGSAGEKKATLQIFKTEQQLKQLDGKTDQVSPIAADAAARNGMMLGNASHLATLNQTGGMMPKTDGSATNQKLQTQVELLRALVKNTDPAKNQDPSATWY